MKNFVQLFTTRHAAVFVFAGLLLFEGVVLISCSNERADPARVAGSSDDYADEDVCVNCHAAEVELWKATNHDNAMMEAASGTISGDFNNTAFKQNGVTTRFYRRSGGFFVETEDAQGELSEFRVTHTFGVEPLQQYLLEYTGGRKQVLPIAWDVHKRRWFNADGNARIDHGDALHWTKPLHNWNMMCAECHATGLVRGFDPTANDFKTTAHRFDVGCQACHGPMSAHVEHPTKTDRSRKAVLETCARCHSRRAPLGDGYDLKRGLHDDYLVSLLDSDLYFDDGQIKGEVYEYGSFVQSKMYEAGVICTDCHDAHSTRLKSEGNALCTSCHNTTSAVQPHIKSAGLQKKDYDSPSHHLHKNNSQGSLCVNCHAPTRTYMQIDPRHDHSFRIPRPDLTMKYGVPNACNQCHANKSASWAAGFIKSKNTLSTSEQYLEAIRESRADLLSQTDQPAIRRATLLERLINASDTSAVTLATRCLTDADPLVRRAALTYLAPFADRTEVGEALHGALGDEVRSVRFAAFVSLPPLRTSTRWNSVRNEYVTAQKHIGGLGDGASNLGVLAQNEGDATLAESLFRQALRENPYSIGAILNLADIVRLRNESEAETIIENAIGEHPAIASLHYALALSLIRQRRYVEAERELHRATQLEPKDQTFKMMLRLVQNR